MSSEAPRATSRIEAGSDLRRPPAKLVMTWIRVVCALLGAGVLHFVLTPGGKTLADVFLFEQDLPALAPAAAALLLWSLTPLAGAIIDRFPARAWTASEAWRWTLAAAVIVAAVGVIGWTTVYIRYPLSMDEFMARFDAAIFNAGQPVARVAPAWRPFVPALTPIFRMHVPDGAFWVSLYLPVNAAFQAIFAALGSPALANGFWSGLSVVAGFGIARRLWPERLDAAVVTAALIATSTQVLITAMTAYAMPAHLALNLVWLWLILRGGRWAHLCAAAVAFAACGLHQVVFHPLFAGPFVLQLWLDRRWGAALFQTLAFAAIGLFWVLYWSFLLHWIHAPPAAAQGVGGGYFIERVIGLFRHFDIGGPGVMATNLFRFVTWQNPLAIALALLALIPAWRAGGTMRGLLVGIVLTIVTMTVLLPFQGHGWGYRYLHGLIGSVCLLAAFAWIRLTDGADAIPRRALWGGLALCSIVSVALLLPLRAYQVHSFIKPYAAAYAAIQKTDADIVVIDPAGMFYADDLTRNDPFLRNRPKIIDLPMLDSGQPEELCAKGKLALFDRSQGLAFGIRGGGPANPPPTDLRQELDQVPCPVGRVKGP